MTRNSLSRLQRPPESPLSSADLGFLANACTELVNCVSIPEVKEVRDRVDALGRYVRNAQRGLELVNKVAEVKIRAERRAGELLTSMCLHGGDHTTPLNGDRITLDKLGVTRWQSCRWQKIASIPEDTFEHLIQKAGRDKTGLSTAALLRLAHPRKRKVVDNDPPQDHNRSHPSRPPRSRPAEIMSELENHCKMLGNILLPILGASGPVEFRDIQRRHIARLISECQSLVCELREAGLSDDSEED